MPSDARPFTPPRPPRRGEPAGLAPPDSAGEAVPAAPEVAAVPPVAREAPEAAPEDGRPFTPPLPPHRPGPEEAGPLPEVSAQAEPSEAPLPPLIATPGTPADPGWTLRNRPDGAVEPEPGGGAAPDAPEPDIGDVAMVDRPAVVEDRPMAPPQPDQDGEDAGIETAARADGAAAGPAAEPWEGEQARVLFDGAETEFGPGVRDMLDRIAARLQRDAGLRLTVLSYAGGEPEAAGRARLLSLTRALAVRDYLTDRNIRQARISVRGLGDSAEQGPTDRIDLLLVP